MGTPREEYDDEMRVRLWPPAAYMVGFGSALKVYVFLVVVACGVLYRCGMVCLR